MLSLINSFLFVLAVIYSHFGSGHGDPGKVDPDLLAQLESGEREDVIISFVDGIKPALDRAAALRLDIRIDRNQALVKELQALADDSQGELVQMLSVRGSGGDAAGFQYFKKYWLGNNVFIKQANVETVLAVAEDPKVFKIHKEVVTRIPENELVDPEDGLLSEERVKRQGVQELDKRLLYALKTLQVEAAWEEFGNKGEGVIIGHIDTGVMADHEALIDSFVGTEYGWIDHSGNLTEPFDDHGHGTHCMGSAVGKYEIGVAPGAKWMTCRSYSVHTGYEGGANRDCLQWMACPTLPDGTNPDCSKAPHIVSNSWVADKGTEPFKEEIMAWRELGIIPIFSIGNSGPKCGTAEPPATYPFVIGVGASETGDSMWRGSSVGDGSDEYIKPDIIAPGGYVISAYPYTPGEKKYAVFTGTSMASPHVAGVVALLKSRDPDITYDQVYDFLTQNTDHVLFYTVPNKQWQCNTTSLDSYPNNIAGYGRINALKVAQAQTAALSTKRRR